ENRFVAGGNGPDAELISLSDGQEVLALCIEGQGIRQAAGSCPFLVLVERTLLHVIKKDSLVIAAARPPLALGREGHGTEAPRVTRTLEGLDLLGLQVDEVDNGFVGFPSRERDGHAVARKSGGTGGIETRANDAEQFAAIDVPDANGAVP